MPKRLAHWSWWNRHRVAIAFVALTLAFVGQGVLLKRLIDRNETARRALCSQRVDLDLRIAATNRILKRHPKEKRIFGIPRSLIVVGRDRDETTRQNLEILDCKETP